MNGDIDLPTSKLPELEHARDELETQIRELEQQLQADAQAHFDAAGGCPVCRGRGWVVTWDTMDSMSGCYAEYGPCPRSPGAEQSDSTWWVKEHAAYAGTCTTQTRAASGLEPKNNKYDKIRGSVWQISDADRELVDVLTSKWTKASIEAAKEKSRWTVHLGCLVKVTSQRARGRNKLPLGTYGEVKNVVVDRWGTTKIVLRAPGGETLWTTQTDLTVIHPDPPVELLDTLGFKRNVGVPVLVSFQGLSTAGRSIKAFIPLTGVTQYIPLSQINGAHARIDGNNIDVHVTTEALGKLPNKIPMTLFLEPWLAKKKGLAQA